ncbi:MAG: transposase [Fidelibacterota bacterium]
MHHKNIKLIVKKQLKKVYPNWQRMNKKEKKRIAKMVLEEAVKDYDFEQEVTESMEELLGIEEQVRPSGIMNIDEMSAFIKDHMESKLIRINRYDRSSIYIKDEELRFVDKLLDDEIINKLLSYRGYTPSMREIFPSQLFRAELLKAIKYPEISYRKFCTEAYIGMDRKENRVFIGLPLHRKEMIDHTELSKFRAKLSFSHLANILVYILHYFYQSDLLGKGTLHGIDSTELASDCRIPLASIKINGKKIRIYNDIDCDSGKRRNKRDKSVYVVGYRLHTLTAINAETGHSYPLVSMLAPANHHDSNFLKPLIHLAQAIGIEVKLITADEAYHDKDGSLFEETGARLITPKPSGTSLPENVDEETMSVTYDDMCEIPMEYMGSVEEGHEFKCCAEKGKCPNSGTCPQFRIIPFDRGYFQRIFHGNVHAQQAVDIRKNSERPFNLLKNQTGLEQVRVRSQHGLLARSIFSTIGTLLLEMAGTRKKKKPDNRQAKLFEIAA